MKILNNSWKTSLNQLLNQLTNRLGDLPRVAVVGIEDVVVIDTPDAVLVTTRSRAQDVKDVVDALKAQGRTDLI